MIANYKFNDQELQQILELFRNYGVYREYEAKKLISHSSERDQITLLVKGEAYVAYDLDQESNHIIKLMPPDSVYGEHYVFSDRLVFNWNLYSRVESSVRQISLPTLKSILSKDQVLIDLMIRILKNNYLFIHYKLFQMVQESVLERVRQTLASLVFDKLSSKTSEGYYIKYTRKELGLMIGASREAVGRVINELATMHEIKLHKSKIYVQPALLTNIKP